MATAQCKHPQCRPKMLSKLSIDRATVIVTEPEGSTAEFSVHSDLLGLHSGFFRDELAKPSSLPAPGSVRTVSLSGQSSDRFELFVAFLYTGRVYTQAANRDYMYCEWGLLARLWKLGEALSSTTFKDAIADATMHRTAVLDENPWPGWILQDLLQSFADPSGLQQFLVDVAVAKWSQESYVRNMPAESFHFLKQVAAAISWLRFDAETITAIRAGFKREGNCKYHDHGALSPCYKELFPMFQDIRQPKADMPNYREIMIELHVGAEDDNEKFVIRKDRAIQHSKFIEKALDPKKGWKEAKEGIIRLPEDSPGSVEMFGVFIDTGHVHFVTGNRKQGDETPGSETHEDIWARLEDAWLLGERLLCPAFKDAVVDELVNQLQRTAEMPTKMHKAIYKNSMGPSGMRRLLVGLTIFKCSADKLREQNSDPECVEFFLDVGVALKERVDGVAPLSAPFSRANVGCFYHDHVKNANCYKSMFEP